MNLDGLKQFLDAFNRHDVEAVMGFFADDAVFVSAYGTPDGQTFQGREAIQTYFARFFQGVKNVRFSEDNHAVAGEQGYSEWTLTGTLPDGSPLNVRGCDLFRFNNGKIARKDTFMKQNR